MMEKLKTKFKSYEPNQLFARERGDQQKKRGLRFIVSVELFCHPMANIHWKMCAKFPEAIQCIMYVKTTNKTFINKYDKALSQIYESEPTDGQF